jgi:hypothetical protein
VGALEHRCWSGGGGFVVIPRVRVWDMISLGSMKHGDIPRSTCHSEMCLVACSMLFIDSKSLIDDGASLDLAMVKVRRVFLRTSTRRRSVATATSFGECKKTYGLFCIFLSFRILSAKCPRQLFSPFPSLSFSFHVYLFM